MSRSAFRQSLYWSGHIARNAPALLLLGGWVALRRYLSPRKSDAPQFLIGTHHKVLTVFLGRVFKVFAKLTNRRASQGRGDGVDASADILLDHHSEFDFTALTRPYVGLHMTRDPRDLLVSAAFYHQKSKESWLHVPQERFNGQTYQNWIKALPDMEARLLFEIDNSAGANIHDMLGLASPPEGMVNARYDQLVGPGAADHFAALIANWPLSTAERKLLVRLFAYFSLGGPGVKGNTHVRNANSGQWQAHFTPAVQAKFDATFPDALARLGYDETPAS